MKAERSAVPRYPMPDDPLSDPGGCFSALRQSSPLARVALPSGDEIWMVTRYDDVQAVLSDPRFSTSLSYEGAPRFMAADGPLASGTLMTTDPPEHTRLRQVIGRAFTPRRVAAFRPAVQRIADDLLDAMEKRNPPADLIEELSPLPMRAVCEYLGIPAGLPGFHPWLVIIASTDGHTASEVTAAHLAGQRQIADLIRQRRDQPGSDLLTALAGACDGQRPLSPRELVALVWTLVVAGQETTVSLIGSAVLRLLNHPDQLAQLRAEPGLLPSAIEEVLRYDGPAERTLFRVATQDIPLSAGTIPKGDAVMAVITSANHDETRFADPMTFQITRAASQHLGFGYGPHVCPGAALARLVAEVTLSRLLDRFQLKLAVPGTEIPWRQYSTRGPRQLLVSW